jgi:hypothetical protein
MGWNAWSIFQAVGSIASIVSAGGIFLVIARCTTLTTAFGYLAAVGISVVVTGYLHHRRLSLQPITRAAMVATGTRLIEHAKEDVLLIAGDMSWAPEYAGPIAKLTSEGKAVRIAYPEARAGAARVQQNMRILAEAGATLVSVKIDTHLRAMIVDPAQRDDAQLYVVERRLRRNRMRVEEGAPGSTDTYQYVGRICSLKDEALLANLAATLRGALV